MITCRAWFLINFWSMPQGLIHLGLGARRPPLPRPPRLELELIGRPATRSATQFHHVHKSPDSVVLDNFWPRKYLRSDGAFVVLDVLFVNSKCYLTKPSNISPFWIRALDHTGQITIGPQGQRTALVIFKTERNSARNWKLTQFKRF